MAGILISVVGNRDPYSNEGVPGSILTAVQELQPTEVFLVYTAVMNNPQSGIRAKQMAELLESGHQIKAHLCPVTLPDPTDYDAVLIEFRTLVEKFRDNHYESDLKVAISSGTPAMQACWLLLISQGLLPAVPYYAPDPAYLEGGAPRLRKVSLGFLQEDALLKAARKHYDSFHFHSTADTLEALSKAATHQERRIKAHKLARYCKALGLWDDYRLGMARGEMRSVVKGFDWAQEKLEVLEQLLVDQKKSETKETLLIFTDLYHNADRSYQRGQFSDSLARVMRTYEGVLKWWLEEKHGIASNMNEISPPERQNDIRSFFSNKGKSLDPRGHLMSYRLELLLVDYFGDKRIKDWQDMVEPLAKKRNTSIVAHGTQEIKEPLVKKGLVVLNQVLTECGCTLAEYTLTSVKLNAEGERLFEGV